MPPSTWAGMSSRPARARWSSILRISKPKPGRKNFPSSSAERRPPPSRRSVATISLAGAKILGFEGVLTGTTNYILSRLEQGLSFEEALKDARARGIAETDPSMDIDGWDTACKVLLLANASAGTEFVLDDLEVEGIRAVAAKDLAAARAEGNALKLLGRLYEEGGRFKADVKVQAVPSSHPLFRLTGTNKGIVFRTDTMGSIAVTDGKSDPRGTAAAVLKDLINIYRDR